MAIPLLLLTGPLLPDLSLVLISVIFLYISIKEKLWYYYNNWFFIIFLSFCIYLILISVVSQNIFLSLESSLFYFRFGIFALAVWFLIDSKKNLIKNFSIIFTIIYVYALFDGYYQFFFNLNLFSFGSLDTTRLSLPLSQKLYLGGYLSRLYPFLFALLIYNSFFKKQKIIFPFILLILSDLLIFLSGERTALALLFISTILIIFFIKKLKLFRFLTLIVSILLMIFITFNNAEIKERNIDKTIKQMQLTSEIDLQNIVVFSKHHENIYLTALKIFKDYPIFGAGPKIFRELCSDDRYTVNKNGCSTHPHNSYIQILAETGLVGFIFISFFIYFIAKQMLIIFLSNFKNRQSKISDYQTSLLICFILTLFPFLPTQNFFNNWINIIYFLPVGFYLHSIYSFTEDKISD